MSGEARGGRTSPRLAEREAQLYRLFCFDLCPGLYLAIHQLLRVASRFAPGSWGPFGGPFRYLEYFKHV